MSLRKIKYITALICIVSILFGNITTSFAQPKNKTFNQYTTEEKKEIINMIKPSSIKAYINKNTTLYSTDSETSENLGQIEKGSTVEIIQDRSWKWYNIKYRNSYYWIKSETLNIPLDYESDKSTMSERQLEAYAYFMNFKSNTNFYVLVDIGRQLTHVFEKNDENWKLAKTFICSSGRNISPTIRGKFKLQEKGEWFYSERLGSGGKYWYRFNGPYLFHSVAMDKNGNIQDNVLGEKRSMGCVRMSVEDIKWFYDNVTEGTTVFIV